MPWYEHGDGGLYGDGISFIWHGYEAFICLRPRGKGGQGSSMAGVQTQTSAQQLASARVEGGRIIVEREVELETICDVKRIALDPRVYILYAYAQKYLGYPGSLGEFLQTAPFYSSRRGGVEVALKLPEAT